MLKLIKTSVIGPGHIVDDLPNQDAVGHYGDKHNWAIIVCDGMGSRPLAHVGARTAIISIKNVLRNSLFDATAKSIISGLYQHWLNSLKTMKVTPNDAVTTVLIAWGDHQGNYRRFQLGDGIICTPSKVITPTINDEFSNVTTGLGLSKKFSDWSISEGILSDEDNSLLLVSDGISEDIIEHSSFTQALMEYSKNK